MDEDPLPLGADRIWQVYPGFTSAKFHQREIFANLNLYVPHTILPGDFSSLFY
jgi:hypothetical protein